MRSSKLCLLFAVTVALLLVYPQDLSAYDFASEAVKIDVVLDNASRIILRYKVDDYQLQHVLIGNEEYIKIWISGEATFHEKGSPALPHISRSIIIPDDQSMAVQVLSSAYEERFMKIAPSKGLISRKIDPSMVPYEFGAIYSADSFYPGPLAVLGEPYIMRDHRGIVVQVNPFQYNPVSGVLRVYTDITIEVTAAGPGGKNILERIGWERTRIRAFEELYRAHFLNYTERASCLNGVAKGSTEESEGVNCNNRPDSQNLETNTLDTNSLPEYGSTQESAMGSTFYNPLDEEGDILIIAHDPWISNLDPYVTHKTAKGFNVNVVGVSTIGNDPTSIKNYIQDVYNTSDLAFVLLAGDAAEVATPSRQVGWENGAYDPWYSKLAGNDDYPDIMVGRFSAQAAAQLDTQVQRTIDYEEMPAYGQDWFKRGTGIASAEGAGQGDEGQSDKQHMEEIRGWLLGAGHTLVDQIYDPGATDTQVADALNAGRGIINYCGHGSATSWGTTGFNVADVDALVNDNMLPFIVSVACNNGEFHHYDKCFAEAWMRATNESTGAPTGAIGTYMSSVSQYWAEPMESQDEFNLKFTDPAQPYSYYGTMCFAGSCSMMDKYGYSGVDMFDTWIVFGDPSLRILGPHGLKVTPDTGMDASGQAGGPYDQMSKDYTLENLDGVPMDYQVTASAPWVTITNPTGTIPGSGSVQVTVMLNDASRNLDNGHYSATVDFVNLRNHDGDTTRPVNLKVGMIAIKLWTLDTDPGWSREGQWQYGKPTGGGGGQGLYPDPTSGRTGSNVFGANIDGNISKNTTGSFYLTTDAIDLTSCTDVRLIFQRWLNTSGPPKVNSIVDVSNDGTNWTNAWSSSGKIAENAWALQSHDISATVDNRNTVYIRWGYRVNERLMNNESSWNIDDIKIEGMTPTSKITLYVDRSRLTWTSVMGAIGYDIVRGSLNALLDTGGDFIAATDSCLGNDLNGTSLDYTENPTGAGQGHWFLVRGVSITGPMTYQSLAGSQIGLRDDEINSASSSCP
ncbi:MAG: C25 family cysteine peptidase [Acidobacteriota bacterium]